MNAGLELISTNTGFGIPDLIFMVVLIGGIIFYARDFKIGLMAHSFAFALLIMAFYGVDYYLGYTWDYTRPLYAFFITIILMAFTLYGAKSSDGGMV